MGLPLPEAGLTQTVFPNMFFMCTMGTLAPSTGCGSFDWAEPAQLVDPLLLTNQVAFAKWVLQYVKVPSPTALSVVLAANCTIWFLGGWCMVGDVIHTLSAGLFGPGVYEVVSEMSPIVWLSSFWGAMLLQDLFFQGLGWCSGWWHGQWDRSPAIRWCIVGTWCLSWRVCGGVIESVCQASPYLYFSHRPLYHWGFTCLACLIAAHVSHSWITCVIVSTSQSWARLASLLWWTEVSWAHRAINSSPSCQSTSTWAQSTCWLLWCFSVAWLLGMWASTWRAFTTSFSSQAATSCHNGAAQIGLPLCCQLLCFHCCSHPHRALATIPESA